MDYNRDEWNVGDFIIAHVSRSAEVKSGFYVYELCLQSDGHRRWAIRSGYKESDLRRAEFNRQRFSGVPHAMADQHLARLCTGIIRLLPDCPCCEEVRNAHHITSDHT